MSKFPLDKIRNILVIQTAFLGDIVLTIPLFNAIKKTYPDKKLCVLTTPVGYKILKHQSAIDAFIIYDKKGKDRRFKALMKLINEVHCMSFDWAIIPHRSFRSALIAFAARISHRWGFNKSEGWPLLTKRIKYFQDKHEIERNLELIKPATDVPVLPIIFPHNRIIDEPVMRNLAQWGFTNQKIIGVHPGSVWKTKRWPIKQYINLINSLAETGYKILVFGDHNDEMEEMCIALSCKHPNVKNLIDKTSIDELVSYLRHLSLYITNDSGPMHIAAALGIPIVAIFGATTPSLGFAPYTQKSIIVQKDIECRPCGKHGGEKCKEETFACMKEISVDEVMNAAKKLLNI